MMTTLSSWLRRGRYLLRELLLDSRANTAIKLCASAMAGFLLSAASLSHAPQPMALGFALVLSGWPAVMACLGGVGGYLLFWGPYGLQGVVWMVLGLAGALGLGDREAARETPPLIPSVAALIVAVTGLVFQLWQLSDIRLSLFLLQIAMAAGTAWMVAAADRREPFALWLMGSASVLALSQTAPAIWCNPGFLVAGAIAVSGAFPAAALAGLALDLAQVSRVPMSAVLCLVYLLRLIPGIQTLAVRLSPAWVHILVCGLTGLWDLNPLPALALGGLMGVFLPQQPKIAHRRGETGVAQVRLEMAAGVLAQAERILLESPELPVDEEALVLRAVERACAGCPTRKNCRDRDRMAAMDPKILHRTLLSPGDLTAACRKTGRVLGELHRSQEQLRAIKAGRDRQEEYRAALIQQYQFLAYYLQDLADDLPLRDREIRCNYRPVVQVYANRPAADNGDRCLWFPGTGEDYFVVLCDGMGTGLGAVDEARTAVTMLRELLSAGFPAEYALRSLNSLCALRDRAGAVTVDLLRIRMDSGRCNLYKWGAAPSYLLRDSGAEKIGTAGPPPGLSVQNARETVSRLSLRRGETLLLLSDGAAGERVPRCWEQAAKAGELATKLLEQVDGQDDATAVLVRLEPASMAL